MGNILLTAAKIAPIFTDPGNCEIYQVIVGETVTAGQALCWHTTTHMLLADGNDAALDEPMAIALEGGLAGEVIRVLRRGSVYGYTVAAVNVGAKITLTDTPGTMEDAGAGELCGCVWALPDGTRVIYFDFWAGQVGIG